MTGTRIYDFSILYVGNVRSILKIIDVDEGAGSSADLCVTIAWKKSMTSTELRQDDAAATALDRKTVDLEAQSDDAWMDAVRDGPDENDTDDSQNEAVPSDLAEQGAAAKQTGDDAMSKFGHAIGALAENEDDLDDRVLDFAAEMASPSSPRDESVAPHIAAAERELERSKAASGPVDIFDRIAQAAESQFDESRGSTTKRVSELVDDRRVGTKRWTPSKTMKQRMAKLEAARAAAAGDVPPVTAETAAPATEPVAATPETEAPVIAASAPSSSTATVVSPDKPKAREPEAVVEAAPMTEEQSVTISRRGRQHDAEDEEVAAESVEAVENAQVEDEPELDADGLRIIPGARGRRRDRARKSRLDEDFEKIFDDEGKPSINSLRRKLRSGAAEEEAAAIAAAEEEAAAVAGQPGRKKKTAKVTASVNATDEAPKKGLFSRFLAARKGKADTGSLETSAELDDLPVVEDSAAPAKKGLLSGLMPARKDKKAEAKADMDEDDLVAAFESDDMSVDATDDYADADDESWEETLDDERKKSQIIAPILGGGAAILLGGLGWFGYKFLTGM